MDKYEYRVKTEQMLDHMEHRRYRKAMEIADQIDWRRVKNPVMLNNVSEIYEYNGEYQKSRDVLFIAYDRAPGSRKTVYRLGTLALRLGDISEASDCYEEFLKLAPKDSNQYILKYKILKARKAPLSEQIKTLEDFKRVEDIEKWDYELACLYDQAGMTAECLEACDELILWFGEGKYVYKAMELKMKYKPLTPLQQEKYDRQKGETLDNLEYPSEAEPEELQAAGEEAEKEAEREEEQRAASEAEKQAQISEQIPEQTPEELQAALQEELQEELQQDADEEPIEDIVSRTMAAVREIQDPEAKKEIERSEPEMNPEPEGFAEPEEEEAAPEAEKSAKSEEPEMASEAEVSAEAEREKEPERAEQSREAKKAAPAEAKEHRRKVHRRKPGIRKSVKGATLEEALRNGIAEAGGAEPEQKPKALNKEDEALRITGQMKIDEILQEWEAKQKEHAQAIADQKKKDEEILAQKRREAERRREEEARRIEEQQRAAEEARRIAEQKAAEEARRLAARRAEEERILAEQKAEEERRRAILKAEEEQRMLERRAAEKAARELEENRRKQAEAEAAKAAEEAAKEAAEDEYEEVELPEDEYEEAELQEDEYEEAAEEVVYEEEADYEEPETEEDSETEESEPSESAEPEELSEEDFTEEDFDDETFDEAIYEELESESDLAQEEEEEEFRLDGELSEEEAAGVGDADDGADDIDADLDELIRRLEADQAGGNAEPDELDLDGFDEEAFDELPAEEEPTKEPESGSAEDTASGEGEFADDDFDGDAFDEDDFDEEEYEEDGSDEEEPEEEAEPEEPEEDEFSIEEPSEEEIQKRIKKGKGGVPFDTGFVVTGRYDLSATSEIGLRAGLTEEQKKLFSYFVPVRGMSEQIVEVLDNDRREKREGTSRTGNILVIGQKGSGKTVLAVDIVKAIQKQRNLKQGKVAIVTGESLNKKELGGIVQKLRGGAIIIEKAGKLNTRTVRELNRLMDRRTGELLVVLEDQRKPLEKLFTANPAFKKKFTSRLELPVFINDELVTFGQTYAKENGYKLDEMGILALYSRIDIMQREDHAVTVAEVKEIMDEAIDHSQKANVKHFARRVFGKGTDDLDRIILKEDDFRI